MADLARRGRGAARLPVAVLFFRGGLAVAAVPSPSAGLFFVRFFGRVAAASLLSPTASVAADARRLVRVVFAVAGGISGSVVAWGSEITSEAASAVAGGVCSCVSTLGVVCATCDARLCLVCLRGGAGVVSISFSGAMSACRLWESDGTSSTMASTVFLAASASSFCVAASFVGFVVEAALDRRRRLEGSGAAVSSAF